MKTLLPFSAIICIIFTLNAEIIRTPVFEARNSPVLRIDSIDNRTDVCRFYITLSHHPNTILKIDSLLLVDFDKGIKWKATDIDGIYFGRNFQFPNSGIIPVEIDFPPIPLSISNVDLIEMKQDIPFRIIGIHLGKKPIPSHIDSNADSLKNENIHNPVSSFKKDSAFICGHIHGYHPRLEFGNGIIHNENVITNTSYDIPVIIDSLGNFNIRFLLDYPIQQTIFFQNGYLHFYLEPGSNLKIETSMDNLTRPYRYVEEIDLSDTITQYGGNMGIYNQELKSIRQLYGLEDNSWIKDIQKLNAEQYREKQNKWLKERSELLSGYINKHHISSHISELAHLNIIFRYGRKLLQYAEYHQRLNKKTNDNFYIFLNDMPLDNIFALSTEDYKIFISLLEKSDPLISIPNWNPEEFTESLQKQGITPTPDENQLIYTIFGNNQPTISDMRDRMNKFNLKYKEAQIAMKEEKSSVYKSQIYNDWGSTGDITFQLLNSRIFVPRLKFMGRKLSSKEFKQYNQYIKNKFILDKLKNINEHYPLSGTEL